MHQFILFQASYSTVLYSDPICILDTTNFWNNLFFRKEKYHLCYNLIFFLLILDILVFDGYSSANSLSFVHMLSLSLLSFLISIIGAFYIGLGTISFTLSLLEWVPIDKLNVNLASILASEYKVRWRSTFPPFQMIVITTAFFID